MTIKAKTTKEICDNSIAAIESRALEDLKGHRIVTRVENGLFRYYRCRHPFCSANWFDIITWPRHLMISGDMGTFDFSRTEDMFPFMRGNVNGDTISWHYVLEKCVAHGRHKPCTIWSNDLFHATLNEFYEERRKELLEEADDLASDGESIKSIRSVSQKFTKLHEKIDDIKESFAIYEHPHDAQRAMFQSGLWDSEIPDCTVLSPHFVWCVYAIKWFFKELDAGNPVERLAREITSLRKHLKLDKIKLSDRIRSWWSGGSVNGIADRDWNIAQAILNGTLHFPQTEFRDHHTNPTDDLVKLMMYYALAKDLPVWLVWSNDAGAYWRENRAGYTGDINQAGRYTLDEAIVCCKKRSREPGKPRPEVFQVAPEAIL